jgi:hypothetical protein
MKTLLVIACLWTAGIGLLQSPNSGTAQQNGAASTNPSDSPKKDHQTDTGNSVPNRVDTPAKQRTESDQRASPASKSNDDIEVQRQLTTFTKYLVWVGIGQAIVLAFTLLVMWRQARIMGTHATHLDNLSKAATSNAQAASKNADAALISAEILKKSQQPQISIVLGDDPTKTVTDIQAPRVVVRLVNKGLTTAYDCRYQSWVEVHALPFVDFSTHAEHFESPEPFSLYPAQDGITLNIPIKRRLSIVESQDILQNRRFVCVRIYLKFRDPFNPDRFNNFGVYVMRDGLGFLPKHNDSD